MKPETEAALYRAHSAALGSVFETVSEFASNRESAANVVDGLFFVGRAILELAEAVRGEKKKSFEVDKKDEAALDPMRLKGGRR